MYANSSPKLRLLDRLSRSSLGLILAASLAVACNAPPANDVLARFDGGEVTVGELEELILALPAATRAGGALEDRPEFYRNLLRRAAMRDLLLERAEIEGLAAQPAMAELLAESRKQLLASALLAREIEVSPPTEAEVEAYFSAHEDRWARPERREVFHIFLRPEVGEGQDELRARLDGLRQRVLAGEPFPLLAREYSQSQLRHGDGALGWVSPGQLAPRLDAIVFGLEEGVPSEILTTRSGAHLFLAATVIEAQWPTVEEARGQALQQLIRERQTEAINLYLESREALSDEYVPTAEELDALLAGGDRNAVVARVGDWTLTAEKLAERLADPAVAGRPGAALVVTRGLVQGQRLAEAAETAGLADEPALQVRLENTAANILLAEIQRRTLEARVEAAPAALEAFFVAEKRRFAGPLRLLVARLAVALAADSGEVMAQLERRMPALADGSMSLEDLATEVGGAIDGPAWFSLAELRGGGPLRHRLAAVAAGGFSDPVSNGRELELFHVIERSEPDVPVLESVRDEVVTAYLQAHGEELNERFFEEELERARFVVIEPNLVRFIAQASGLADAAD